VLVLGGCGSSVVDQPTAGPTAVPPPASGPCASIPTIDPSNPPESLALNEDATLEAEFPSEIDGQALTDVASGGWIETLCLIGGPAWVDAASRNLPAGLDLSTMSVGSASATVDGQPVTMLAFRLPGHRGDELLGVVAKLSAAIFPGTAKFTSALTVITAGGKSVTRWTNPADGTDSYLYAGADTLWLADSIDQSQADEIFAALP